MPPEQGGPEAERRHVEIANAAIPTVERARRAADNAVRSIFELATLLEFLSEAIERYHDETVRLSREWP